MAPPRKKPIRKVPVAHTRNKRMTAVKDLVADLHDADFRQLLIESVQMDETYYAIIYIEKREMDAESMDKLIGIANSHDATVALRQLGTSGPSYMSLWPVA